MWIGEHYRCSIIASVEIENTIIIAAFGLVKSTKTLISAISSRTLQEILRLKVSIVGDSVIESFASVLQFQRQRSANNRIVSPESNLYPYRQIAGTNIKIRC